MGTVADTLMIYQLNAQYFVRPLDEMDLNGPYPSWFEDQEVCRFNSHGKFFKTKASFREYVGALDREDRVVWAVCHVDDGHIGNISLQGMSFINRTAEFAILMGDKRRWRRGVALLAGRALLQHGFDKLNLERIYCGTAATNEGMKKLAAGLGMTLEGTRRKHLFLEGIRVDVLEYGILRDESTKRLG
jgi:[ribosomal protein S5]-alanine N-acetyltransferase